MVEVFIMRLHGRALSECLMRPVGVVEALEFGQLDVQGADAELAVVELVELVAAGRVGAHVAKLRDQARGLELLDREAGLDGDAQVVDLHHLAGLSPAVAAAPALGLHAPGGGRAGREAVLAHQHGADQSDKICDADI